MRQIRAGAPSNFHRRPPAGLALATQAEFSDQLPITLQIPLLKVVEEAASLADQLEQSAAGVMVFLVRPEVLGQLLDPPREKRDLDLGRPGIRAVAAVRADDLLLRFLRQRHRT